jgi:hypothetical protein
MLGFLEKDQQLLQPIETRAVKLEIFELENLKFTNFLIFHEFFRKSL